MATLTTEMVAAQEDCLRSPEHAEAMAAYREAQMRGKMRKEGDQ